MQVRLKVLLLSVVAVLILTGASTCRNSVGEGDQRPPCNTDKDCLPLEMCADGYCVMADTGTADGTDDTGDCSDPEPGDVAWNAEYEMRFTGLEFIEDTPLSNFNTLLGDAFEDQTQQYPAVVLFRVRQLDPENQQLEVRAGAGLKDDLNCIPVQAEDGECAYKWDPEQEATYYEADFNPDTGVADGVIDEFVFVATFEFGESLSKTEIPIQALDFEGTFDPDCSDGVSIGDGYLTGYITEEDADNVEVVLSEGSDPLILGEFLRNTNQELNYDSDDDGTDDSWVLEANFTAKPTRIVDEQTQ